MTSNWRSLRFSGDARLTLRFVQFTLFIIAVAASEAAIGLALVISLYRSKATYNFDEVNLLKR